MGTFLAVETYALANGHIPDYKDAVIGGLCYAGDRVKNKIIDIGIPRFEDGFKRFSSYLENKLKQ